jgi:alpha-tubulin suppressor-like RCC1 family protein
VKGPPRGDRAKCTGTGDAVCGGSCDGTNRAACAYPTVECRKGSCATGVTTVAATCSNGVCPPVTTTVCANTTKTKYCGPTSCVGATQVVAGYDFSCALMTDQTVRCWGSGGAGQLGQGAADLDDHLTPVTVKGLTGVTKLTASVAYYGHVCALLGDQTARCWGSGAFAVLGNGATDDSPVPVQVMKSAGVPFTGIKDISTGQNVTCLLDTTGAPYCWGYEGSGAVGDGVQTNTTHTYPIAVTNGGTGNSSIWVGYNHACMTTTATNTSGVKCWGDNSQLAVGMAGGGIVATAQAVPSFAIANGSLVSPIMAGGTGGVSCAITQTSTVSCWGDNSKHQLGRDGTTTDSATPSNVCRTATVPCTAVADVMAGVKKVGLGEYHACAITDTSVKCWGASAAHGELGDGNLAAHFVANASVGPTFASQVTQLAVGGFHTCVLLADQSVQCWGWNGNGQLGNNSQADVATPVATLF